MLCMCVLQRNLRSERERERERERETERKKMAKQIRFNDKVSQAVFDKSKGSKRCIDIVESCPLAEEDEVAGAGWGWTEIMEL